MGKFILKAYFGTLGFVILVMFLLAWALNGGLSIFLSVVPDLAGLTY
jgi:hypothetical protein